MKNLLTQILFICSLLTFSFAQINWAFTNCGQEGRFGPTLEQCEDEYLDTSLEGQVTIPDDAGIQEWTVPYSGIYTIESRGAKGGYNGGFGARMRGEFELNVGDILNIVVGQQGLYSGIGGGGGGGGGTFVYTIDENLLISAGGGGGGGESGEEGLPGNDDTYGTGSCGGSGGNAGYCGTFDGSGAGAGWNSEDIFYGECCDCNGLYDLVPAKSRPTWSGGEGNRHCTFNHGGFGGGGASIHPGGGGGGYSGGSGDDYNGGGGGSYNDGTNQENESGVNEGHGLVVITFNPPVWIEHAALENTSDTAGPYTVTANITSFDNDLEYAKLFYRISGGDFSSVDMVDLGDDNYTEDIQGQPLETRIDYYIEASDGEFTSTSPDGAPEEVNTFYISLLEEFVTLQASSVSDGSIDLTWETPQLTEGISLLSLGLYKSDDPGVTFSDFLAELDASDTSYTDTDVFEGQTFSYRLGATVFMDGDISNLFVSEEAEGLSDQAGIVVVFGYVALEGTDDYRDVTVEFERISPTASYDTVYTDTTGYYSHIAEVGIYNVNFSKYGWQPYQLGYQYLVMDKTLDTVTLEEGFAVYVEGEVSGEWTSDNLYFVEGDIIIPNGDTLAIEAGTRVIFTDEYDFTAYGVLHALGDSLDHVEFTSGQPVPAPRDWGSLTLHSQGNILSYVDYRYADNGIGGENVSNSVFDHCTITDIPQWSDTELRINCHGMELENCQNCVFNGISVDGPIWEAIMINGNATGSIFTNNTISTTVSNVAIFINSGTGLTITGNSFTNDGSAVYANNANNSVVANNTVESTYGDYAFYMDDCDSCEFQGNIINNPNGSGIRSRYSENSIFDGNELEVDNYGFDVQSGSNLTFTDNTVTGFRVYGIYFYSTGNSTFRGNNLISGSGGDWALYNNYYNNNSNAVIQDNTIDMSSGGGGVYVRGALIEGNTISNSGSDAINCSGLSEPAIISGNTIEISGSADGIVGNFLDIQDNTIIGSGSGRGIRITGPGEQSTLANNTIIQASSGVGVYVTSYVQLLMHHNLVISGDTGLDISYDSGGQIYNNTFVGLGSGSGLYVSNTEANPQIFNNIFTGYSTGVVAQSDLSIQYNDIWNNDTNFSGEGLPLFFGDEIGYNYNGDPSDIYANIFLDPLFMGLDNYHLEPGSPCINAGSSDYTDPDGTVSDIGMFVFDSSSLSIDDVLGIPREFTLHQNYPNPFNPITTLKYDLPIDNHVTLTIYDLNGREIKRLVNTVQPAGLKSIQWNATDVYGKSVSAGVYLYQIRAGEYVQTRKMVLLK